ncbi:MAG: hypothetical protein RLZZ385_1917 [Pseudomonadota bacterium]|jgi:hypothetical protein
MNEPAAGHRLEVRGARWLLGRVLDGLALFFIVSALVLPNRLSWIGPTAWNYFPLEAVLIGLLLLVPGRGGRLVHGLCAVALAAGIVFRIADMSAFLVFARPFNPVLDTYLLSDGMNFLSSSFGRLGASLAALAVLGLVLLIIWASWHALGRVRRWVRAAPRLSGVVLLAGLAAWTGMALNESPRASRYFIDQLHMHVRNTLTSFAELQAFHSVVNLDPYGDVPGEDLFGGLQGKDVLVVFVESYGRIVLDLEEYSAHIRPVLERATASLADQGFQARSGFLTSPTVGGISWLAHGTALSGLWIDSQIRYDSLVISQRPSLVRLFQRAGWRTVGVMPAITLTWPEGQYFGYDQLYTASDLDYRGLPFNYVTMPDQFTLAQFQRRERESASRGPIMAEIALISSHAPWTPIPDVIDWQSVGDGLVFNDQARAGDPPEVMWQDKARVLQGYRDSIAYVIDTLVSYVTTYGDDDLVVMILGDHQPMPYVTEEAESRDVPVHFIARDPAVLDAIAHWQWSAGMLPADAAPTWRMDELRDRFIEAFSGPR